MIKAIIFDLDGTLIDGVEDLHAAMNMLLAEQGIASISKEAVESFIGDGIGALVARSYLHAGVTPDDLVARIDRFKAIYAAQGYPLTRLHPGVLAALTELGASHRLGLCTNKDETHARAILEKCGIAHLFSVVVGGNTLSVCKPDPRVLVRTAQGCRAQIDEIIYVGDSKVDVELCRAAGAMFFFFTEGHRSGPFASPIHVASFSDYALLPGLVRLAQEGAFPSPERKPWC